MSHGASNNVDATPEWCKQNNIHAISPDKAIIRAFPEIVDHAHAAGVLVVPWTLRPETARSGASTGFGNSSVWEAVWYMQEAGVDGIFMDNPETGLAAKTWLESASRGWLSQPALAN